VWGADRVGIRIGPSNKFGGMGDSAPDVTFPYVARALARFGLAYLHVIEPRVTGNVSDDAQQPVAAGQLRPLFGGPVIAAGGFDAAGAEAILAKGDADLVAFGRHFLANPDLPERLRRDFPLNPYDRTTFYYGGTKGYADYPIYEATRPDGTPDSAARATALGLAAAGAQVLIQHGGDAKRAETIVEQMRKLGARAGTVSANLADPEGPHKLANQVRGIIGDRLDILVANMGTAKAARFQDTTAADFDGMFAANVRAPFFLIQQFLPLMCRGSCIIFVTSPAAPSTSDMLSAYVVTTGAIETITQHFASVLRPRGIRVNRIGFGEAEAGFLNFSSIHAGRESALSPQAKRLEQLDDVGTAVSALASNDVRFVTGDTVRVSGSSNPDHQ
jgi:NAD(P)-dependent dehydrogenase (short-subunit alcohol dehydrogenase family)